MARPLRIESRHAICLVTSRGNARPVLLRLPLALKPAVAVFLVEDAENDDVLQGDSIVHSVIAGS